MPDAEKEFETLVLTNLDEAERLLDCSFSGLRRMIQERGAVGAACHILAPANIGQTYLGFTRLAAGNLLHRSLEGAVLQFQDRGVFPNAVIVAARARVNLAQNARLESQSEK